MLDDVGRYAAVQELVDNVGLQLMGLSPNCGPQTPVNLG